ncbi:5'-3' exonuclease [Gilvimarinus sp. F26214L]|uniref:5'-3' exonuclease n=1 Tax=Gilvimarinus sp. DZF01 TaxID=3461371 RepID=UPI004046073A
MTASAPNAPANLLIDASIYIFQYYFSLPDNWFSDCGQPTGAVYGYTTFLLRLLEAEQPSRIAACFDESLGSCFRNSIYPDYKSSRAHPDDDLLFQLQACREVTELLGIASFGSREYEADDLLGTLGRKLRRSATPIAILTRDKDLGQLLVREQDHLWDYSRNERFYPGCIHRKFGVHPQQLVDYLALVGDSIDDIPGVPGLGPKTARALLGAHNCIDTLYEKIDELHQLPIRGAKNLAAKLRDYREQVAVARQLARIVDTVPLDCGVNDLNWNRRRGSLDLAADFCERMGFPRLLSRFEKVLLPARNGALT